MKRSKHGLFVFPPKKTLIWRRHPSIGQWCCSMTSKRSIHWFLESSRAWEVFSPERSLNQSKATSVCIRSTNQSYCLFPFFCCVCFQGHSKIALNRQRIPNLLYPKTYIRRVHMLTWLTLSLAFMSPSMRLAEKLSCHFLNQSEIFPTSTATFSPTFSRAWCRLHETT